MIRCEDCGRIAVQETVRLRGRLGLTPWWWCMFCGKRVAARYVRDGSKPMKEET